MEAETTSMKTMYIVWGGLLGATLAEVLMAYVQMSLGIMLVLLLGLSVFKAFLIMAWFMHLKFERTDLILTLIPALVMCILLFNVFFPDALRIAEIGIR